MNDRVQIWSIGKVLSWASDDFRSRGVESPRLEAELLLAHVLGCDRVRLILDAERPLSADELTAFRALIVRRRRHEPIAYILERREFHGLDFRVDSRVLVPRPDTETLVETALRRTQAHDQFGRALDLCTGSGCVAIAFAARRPNWEIWGTDLSEPALELARDNALRLGAARIVFRAGDLFGAVPNEPRFDLITANPPYIPHDEIATLEAQVRDFEPRSALDGGPDGLELVRRVVDAAPRHLASGGVLAVEIGHDQADATERLFEAAGFEQTERDTDYGGRQRVVSGKWLDKASRDE